MKKIFVCVWGNGYEDATNETPKMCTQKESFFRDDNGYSNEDIATIITLEIGETWKSTDGNVHFVTRMQ